MHVTNGQTGKRANGQYVVISRNILSQLDPTCPNGYNLNNILYLELNLYLMEHHEKSS